MLSLLIWFINMQTDMQQPESIHARQDAQRAITLTKVGLLKCMMHPDIMMSIIKLMQSFSEFLL